MARPEFSIGPSLARRAASAFLVLAVGIAAPATAAAESLGNLRERIAAGPASTDLILAGQVRAFDRELGLLALEDESAAAILKLTLPDEAWTQLRPGAGLELDFQHTLFSRGDCVIECGTGPVVELFGRSPRSGGVGSVYLEKGYQAVRIEWFNAYGDWRLKIDVKGPQGEEAAIPAGWLWHVPADKASPVPGLRYELFEVPLISGLDEIPASGALREGIASGIDASLAEGKEGVAMRFSGLLSIPADGEYRFNVESNDGARLHAGGSAPRWKILPALTQGGDTSRAVGDSRAKWSSQRGRVTYAAEERLGLHLELISGSSRIDALVLNPRGLEASAIQGRLVTISGVAQAGGLHVLGKDGLSVEDATAPSRAQLSTAAEVRELRAEEAEKALPVVLEGVVTMANYRSMVIQDSSGGIFVLDDDEHYDPLPKAGERWRLEGWTQRGDFSPIVRSRSATYLGDGALPAPRKPTWEELQNGSPDAEQVEIEGVIVSARERQVELLTREGTVVIYEQDFYPLPERLRHADTREALLGSRVRIRGVFAPSWDRELLRLQPGVFSLGNASLAEDASAPESAEDVPLATIPDLWSFTSKSTALDRVRLKGQMMARRGDLYLISDGSRTLRLSSRKPLEVKPGDEVEAVGFARTGRVSPLLLYPELKVTGGSPLPVAVPKDPQALPDVMLDGKMLSLEARVLSDTLRQNERSLELESGPARFLAVVPGDAAQGVATLARDTLVRVSGVYFGDTSGGPGSGSSAFELRLADGDGIAVLARPPWWTARRLGMLVGALLGGLALVATWAMVLHRLVAKRSAELAAEIGEKEHAESERTLEMERARVARDLHDELGAGLTEIGMLSSLLEKPEVPAATKSSYIATLRDVSRSLVGGLDEIVWAVNPGYDSVDDAASYLWLQAQRLLKPAGIECRLINREELPYEHLGSRLRHSLLLAFKEAVNNVVRHSQASVVELGIAVDKRTVVVTVADNGQGFDPADPAQPGSQGLAGMRQRLRELGGDCEITSAKTQGTTVKLILPL